MNKLDEILYDSLKINDAPDQEINRQIISKWEQEDQTMKAFGPKRSGMKKPFVAACIAILVLATGGVAVATIHFSMWKTVEPVKKYVRDDIYTDSDQHVTITIEELLSDAVCVQGLMKLEAKDEEGKRWMKELVANKVTKSDGDEDITTDSLGEGSNVVVDKFSIYIEGKSAGVGTEFIKSASTDTTQYYSLSFDGSDSALLEKQAKATFSYQLPTGIFHKEIDVTCNVPVQEYALHLDSKEGISNFFEPQKIRITPLSYVIYGENHGFYESGKTYQRMLLSEEEEEKESIEAVHMITKNSKKVEVGVGWSLCGMWEPEQKNTGFDIMIVSNTFEKIIEPGKVEIPKMNIDNFCGVQITNNRTTATYSFVKEDSSK